VRLAGAGAERISSELDDASDEMCWERQHPADVVHVDRRYDTLAQVLMFTPRRFA
jgi:hypothetical protein